MILKSDYEYIALTQDENISGEEIRNDNITSSSEHFAFILLTIIFLNNKIKVMLV